MSIAVWYGVVDKLSIKTLTSFFLCFYELIQFLVFQDVHCYDLNLISNHGLGVDSKGSVTVLLLRIVCTYSSINV